MRNGSNANRIYAPATTIAWSHRVPPARVSRALPPRHPDRAIRACRAAPPRDNRAAPLEANHPHRLPPALRAPHSRAAAAGPAPRCPAARAAAAAVHRFRAVRVARAAAHPAAHRLRPPVTQARRLAHRAALPLARSTFGKIPFISIGTTPTTMPAGTLRPIAPQSIGASARPRRLSIKPGV